MLFCRRLRTTTKFCAHPSHSFLSLPPRALILNFGQHRRQYSADTSVEKAKLVRQLSESRSFTVRQLLESQDGSSATNISNNLHTVEENKSLHTAAAIMVEHEVGSLMVTCASDGVTLKGIVTERDYLRAFQSSVPNKLIGDIMTPRDQLITVTLEASITECVTLMTEHQFRHLPVLGANDDVMGMVGSRALLKCFLEYHEIQIAHLENFLPYPVW